MNFLHDLLMNPGYAKGISLLIAFIMFIVFFWPLNMVGIYILIRPIANPYAYPQYTLFGEVPLTAIFSVILIMAAFVNGLFKSGHTLVNWRLIPLYLVVLLSSISFYNTPSIVISIGGMLKILTAVATYTLVYNSVHKGEDIRKLLWIYVLCAVIPMLFGYYQYMTGTGHAWKAEYYAGKRIDSFLGEWNAYGEFLCISISAALSLLNMPLEKRPRALLLAIMASLIVSLILSLNRGSWISLGLGILGASFAFRRKLNFKWLVAAIIVILVGFGGTIAGRFSELEQTNPTGRSKNTFEARIKGWKKIVPLIKEHPLTGNGLDTSKLVTGHSLSYAFVPHNDYLRMALEVGLPAALLYFLFLAGEVAVAYRRRHSGNWAVNYALLIITIHFFILSVVQNMFTNVIVFPMFLGLLALGHKSGKREAYDERQDITNG